MFVVPGALEVEAEVGAAGPGDGEDVDDGGGDHAAEVTRGFDRGRRRVVAIVGRVLLAEPAVRLEDGAQEGAEGGEGLKQVYVSRGISR